MKIKTILLVNVLLLVVSTNVQAMGGARDFARKLFISKTAAFAGAAGCINGAVLVYRMDKEREDWVKNCMEAHLSLNADKTIKDIFAQDGIDITILKHSNRSMPVSVLHHSGKSMLFLSDEVVAILNDHIHKSSGIGENKNDCPFEKREYFQLMNKGLPDTITKDEIFSVMEHEKSHLKDYDVEKRVLLQMTYLPSIILSMKAARLCGRGRIVTGVMGLAQLPLAALFHYAFIRQQEKKSDLSLSTSKAALSLASFLEKYHDLESEKIEQFVNRAPGGENITLEGLQSSPFALHPPLLERVHYLCDHAHYLEEQERAAQKIKK